MGVCFAEMKLNYDYIPTTFKKSRKGIWMGIRQIKLEPDGTALMGKQGWHFSVEQGRVPGKIL